MYQQTRPGVGIGALITAFSGNDRAPRATRIGGETDPAIEVARDDRVSGATASATLDGKWLGHDIASPAAFRASGTFQRFEGDALVAVLEGSTIGADTAAFLRTTLEAWAGDGSLVLGRGAPAPEVLAARLEAEGVTRRA